MNANPSKIQLSKIKKKCWYLQNTKIYIVAGNSSRKNIPVDGGHQESEFVI